MNVLDLFSGIGGFSLGLERAGMRTVAFCEIKPWGRRIIAKHWPGVPCYDDVRTLTAERLRADRISVDVICGGFPCQDISSAGYQAGIEAERSGLWSQISRLVGELRPRYAIVENVANLLAGPSEQPGQWFGVVLGDLAALGYDAEWHCIPASAVGARHRRDRVWIIAYPQRGQGVERFDTRSQRRRSIQAEQVGLGSLADVADAERWRLQGGDVERSWAPAILPPAFSRYCRGGEFGETWRTEPDVGRVAYGIPHGMDRLEGLGNAVVPQIPEIIGRAIMKASALPPSERNADENTGGGQ